MAQTEAQLRASAEYHKRQDAIMLRPSRDEGAAIRAAAAAEGMSVQGFILAVLRERTGYRKEE